MKKEKKIYSPNPEIQKATEAVLEEINSMTSKEFIRFVRENRRQQKNNTIIE